MQKADGRVHQRRITKTARKVVGSISNYNRTPQTSQAHPPTKTTAVVEPSITDPPLTQGEASPPAAPNAQPDASAVPAQAQAPAPDDAAAKAAKRKKKKAAQWREIRSFFTNLITMVVAVWAVFTFVFGVYILDGEGMYPRMRDGDLVLFYRLKDSYVVDDVLTFTSGDTRYTARYVAMAGDEVNITEDGYLIINGATQTEEIFYATYPLESDITYPYTVPEGCIFLLGDFRTQSIDSRTYGAVPLEDIDGKVITLLRRRVI